MSATRRLAGLAGWGHRAATWSALPLTGASLSGFSLPGHEPAPGDPPLDCSLGGAAAALAGEWDVVMGWSLGGLGAIEAVRSGRVRPRGLVLLATPPSFLARPSYPAGLAAQTLDDFRAGLFEDPAGTLRRFYALQFQGDTAPRATWAGSRDRFLATAAEPTVLAAWLEVLAAADLRAEPPALTLPVLALHGAADPIVDPAAADFLAGCSPDGRARRLAGAGHAPHIAHAEETGKRIAEFARQLPR